MSKSEALYTPGAQPNFPKPKDLGDRPWGVETLLCHAQEKFIMKKLYVKRVARVGCSIIVSKTKLELC